MHMHFLGSRSYRDKTVLHTVYVSIQVHLIHFVYIFYLLHTNITGEWRCLRVPLHMWLWVLCMHFVMPVGAQICVGYIKTIVK